MKDVAIRCVLASPGQAGELVQKLSEFTTKFTHTATDAVHVIQTEIEQRDVQPALGVLTKMGVAWSMKRETAPRATVPAAAVSSYKPKKRHFKHRNIGGLRVRDWVSLILATQNEYTATSTLLGRELRAIGYKSNSMSPAISYLKNDGFVVTGQGGLYTLSPAGLGFLRTRIGDRSPQEVLAERRAETAK